MAGRIRGIWEGAPPQTELNRPMYSFLKARIARAGFLSAIGAMLAIGAVSTAAIIGLTPLPMDAQVVGKPVRDSARAQRADTVRVRGRIDDLVGSASSASEGRIGSADIRRRPITREGELLEAVPGLIVTQHSGEGKANQYFVRGFNLDHGTDFQTRVDGMPVNMPTHGHGQGWTDLNFLIPELVESLDYRLGVHHAELGDFGSAGGAEFRLFRRLPRSFAIAEGGANGLARLVGAGSPRLLGGNVLLAGETKAYDGPWERAGGVRKVSGLARYARERGASQLTVTAMGYANRWNANDQIAERAVTSGLVSRLGQIDSTNAGAARRFSLSANLQRAVGRSIQKADLYVIRSDLELYSNFTYFLDDPERGDQFSQTDGRTVVGGAATNARSIDVRGVTHDVRTGVQGRADFIDNLGLYRTQRRERFATVREDDVHQVAGGVFVETTSRWRPWFRSVLAVRGDIHRFGVRSDRAENSGVRTASLVSPKLSLAFTPAREMELYASGGSGFHSNDARGTTITTDPVTGEHAKAVDPLVRSRGGEIGIRTTTQSGLRSTLALWTLALDGELRFVGDAGGTEPSAATSRRGVTFANFYRIGTDFTLDADVSLAGARFTGAPQARARIPGALERVAAGGVSWSPARGPYGALRLRYFGGYPLNEGNTVRAGASALVSADAGIRLASGLRLQFTLLNALNGRAEDIAYYYTSRLRGEPAAGVEGVHAHPAEPRQIRVALAWRI